MNGNAPSFALIYDTTWPTAVKRGSVLPVYLIGGSVVIAPTASTAITAPTQSIIGSGVVVTVLAANPARKRYILQNCGTTRLYVGLGFDPSGSNYHFGLEPGGSTNDASSVKWVDTMWQGDVRVISSANGGLLNWSENT